MELRVIQGGAGDAAPRSPKKSKGPDAPRRLFFAIDLPADLRATLERTVEAMSLPPADVRLVRGGNLHITLKFLGDVAPAMVDPIVVAARRAVARTPSFDLTVEGVGVYPNDQDPKVFWFGAGGEVDAARRLETALSAVLEPLGFPPDERAYTPHLTIGRVKNGAVRGKLKRLVREKRGEIIGAAPVVEIVLYESCLSPDGTAYHPVARIPLEEKG
jgi:2'-5' RNA ligase